MANDLGDRRMTIRGKTTSAKCPIQDAIGTRFAKLEDLEIFRGCQEADCLRWKYSYAEGPYLKVTTFTGWIVFKGLEVSYATVYYPLFYPKADFGRSV